VFKKFISPGVSVPTIAKQSDAATSTTPKGITQPPEGQTSAESVLESIAPNASTSKVRRQEDIFSGSGQNWHQEDGDPAGSAKRAGSEPGWLKRTTKWVFLAGTLTDAMAYIIGVLVEHAGA
jgi:hypothetical protein